MERQIKRAARGLVSACVRRARAALVLFAAALAALSLQVGRLETEIGYPSYFGPDDPGVRRLERFLEEFQSGLHVVIALGCQGGAFCQSAFEPRMLDLLGRMQSEIDRLPNVRNTFSVLNVPIVVGSLEARTLAKRTPDGRYALVERWEDLARRAPDERFLAHAVISSDARTAGLVVEFQSVESGPLRELVHAIVALRPRYERELGGEIYVAGDPVWTVLSSDDLDRDSMRLSALMVAVMLTVLWVLFRDLRLVALPLVAVAAVAASTYGMIALLALPLSAIIAAIPPLLVVIGTASSMHFLTAYLRSSAPTLEDALVEAAEDVGAASFWCAVTTASGFAAFLWSPLRIFRDFGLVASIGVVLAFLVTFTAVPALLALARRRDAAPRATLVLQLLGVTHDAVVRRPRLVLWLGLATLSVLAVGTLRLRYASDVGFGEQSYVLRSVRFIEANFRKPMTTELVVSVPAGSRVYEERTLRLLDRIERHLAAEPSTGAVWSLLDFVEEAYRIDHGKPAASLDELVAAVPRAMPIVASFERASAFWSESVREDGTTVDAARISVDRGWLDDQEQGPYLDRLRRFVAEVSADVAPEGYRVELEGGLVLAERAVTEIRATQWSSFTSAFASVSVVFGLLLFGSWRLMASAIVVNVLPVFALLGLMGWVGIGMEPANAMVAAILLGIVVDDTIHLSLRYREREEAGDDPSTAVFSALTAAGEPIVITALCLGVGFAMLTFSSWGGLASFGLLASLGIIVSAAAELLLLPAAILVRGERSAIRSASNVEA